MLDSNDLARLRSQTARGELILFTGAGFSAGARDHSGVAIPSSGDLRRELWQLCYPSEDFDDSSSLGDLYAASLRKTKSGLLRLIQARLTVDPDSLPEYYQAFFNFPWSRCYTLNVDDLDAAVARRFSLERPLLTISAMDSAAVHLPDSSFAASAL
ncbi:MAG: hypothetical protein ABSH47_25305 [Bryobacteraceae bacterium]|jgi:hypothetical protein